MVKGIVAVQGQEQINIGGDVVQEVKYKTNNGVCMVSYDKDLHGELQMFNTDCDGTTHVFIRGGNVIGKVNLLAEGEDKLVVDWLEAVWQTEYKAHEELILDTILLQDWKGRGVYVEDWVFNTDGFINERYAGRVMYRRN